MEDSAPPATRVQVVVRVRPVLAHESSEQVSVQVAQDGARVQVQLPDKSAGSKDILPGTARMGARSYGFDACLPGKTTQVELSEACGIEELVGQALDGYCVTVFAFGQTGSGKTYTMVGPRLSRGGPITPPHQTPQDTPKTVNVDEEEDGLLPRCIAAAYAGIRQRAEKSNYKVSLSCLELYNEAVTDLLGEDKNRQLQVRRDERQGFKVDGLNLMSCPTAGAALSCMSRALAHRHTRAHAMNEYSSRSHCMMSFSFDSQEKTTDFSEEGGASGGLRRNGRLVLVDLAGSERLKETGSTGRDAIRETGAINKSLFVLGQVLASLASKNNRNSGTKHVPFRDSKLTQLLWGSLRGDGRVLMLACLNPLAMQTEETINTLHFASMALRIKAQPVVLLDPQDALVLELRTTIKKLQQENRQLASAMSMLSTGAGVDEVLAAMPDHLRLAAARDSLASAPAASHLTAADPVLPLLKPGLSTPAMLAMGSPSFPVQLQSAKSSFTTSPQRRTSTANSRANAYLGAASPKVGSNRRSLSPTKLMRAARDNVSPITSSFIFAHQHSLYADADSGPPQALGSSQPKPMELNDYPELAAMEAEFQHLLSGASKPLAKDAVNDKDQAQEQAHQVPPSPPPVKAEPKALRWAERNTWFGSDEEMTRFAYEVHDDLVNVQRLDAGSDEYYDTIDAKVSERFPEKYAQWQAEADAAAAATAALKAASKSKGVPARKPRAFPAPQSHNVSGALRSLLREPMPWQGQNGPRLGNFSPSRGYSNTHSGCVEPPSPLSPVKHSNRHKRHAKLAWSRVSEAKYQSASMPPQGSLANNSEVKQSPTLPVLATEQTLPKPGSRQTGPKQEIERSQSNRNADMCSPTPTGSNNNPYATKSVQPSPAQSMPASPARQAVRKNPRSGNASAKPLPNPNMDMLGSWSWDQMQQEYMRQRKAVLAELKMAKEEAETERNRILARIGNTLGNSRWRN